MPDQDGGKLALDLYLSKNRLDLFVVDDLILQLLNIVLLSWVVGMPLLGNDDWGYFSGLILVLSFVVACPGVLSLGQSQVPDNSIVVFLLLGRHYDILETIWVKRSSRLLVIIGNEIIRALSYLSCRVWLWAWASRRPETSIFLTHFFLFCLPFSPFTFTNSAIQLSTILLQYYLIASSITQPNDKARVMNNQLKRKVAPSNWVGKRRRSNRTKESFPKMGHHRRR